MQPGQGGLEQVKQLETRQDIDGLLALLDLAQPVMLRRAAAKSLANIAPGRVVESLAEHLTTETDRGVRQSLVLALGRLGDDQGLAALLQALQDRDLMVSEEAANALARYNTPAAFEALLATLSLKTNSQDWQTRRLAAESLGKLGDRRAVPALIESLRDPHNLVRPAVALALGQLGDLQALGPLKKARHTTPHQRGAECAECSAIDTALKLLQTE